MQPIEFIYLGVLFIGAGLLAVLYYRTVPDAAVLKQRLPNRPSVVSVLLAVAVPLEQRQAMDPRPAPVAIHDDTDMFRDIHSMYAV